MKTRNSYNLIRKQEKNRKISLLIGPRQVGKTTILKELQHDLGGLFLDMDIFSNFERVSTYENFINALKGEGYHESQKSTFYVFLDEFQRYTDITKIMKNIYDHHPNIKIFATGSSSLNIKNQVQESLAGRKITTYIYPLSFEEFLLFKEKNQLIEKVKRIKALRSASYMKIIPELTALWEEFLIFGGYPEVVLSPGKKEKRQVLESIFDLYVKKDLVEYLKIDKIQQAKVLIEQIAINHGGIANYAGFGMTAGLDSKTVKNYIELLKETYLINVVKPFFSNKNKELSKAPKLYFLDNGVRNYFYHNFNHPDIRNDAGQLLESYYISELIKRGEDPDHIKYYRTKAKSEVDIVIDRVSEIIPIELKWKAKNSPINLQSFMKNYRVSQGYLVNTEVTGKKNHGIKTIDCLNQYF